MSKTKNKISPKETTVLLETLKKRFEKNKNRHKGIEWSKVQARLEAHPAKMWSLQQMEDTAGEPDVTGYDKKTGEYIFCDCSPESPNRRSFCYDRAALNTRKEHKPKNSVMDVAAEMGIEILTEEQYYALHEWGPFDAKTSNWIATPAEIRKLGGALFCDYRFGRVFTYCNGAESYYAGRGFRGMIKI